MFFSVWLICKVVAISFSHRKQCLITTSFDIVPSAPLHLNQFFYLCLYLNIKKVLLLLNTNNLYKLQTSLVALTFTWRLSYQGYFCFKYFTFSWEAAIQPLCSWKCFCFGHFERLTYFHILLSPDMHLSCQKFVKPVHVNIFLPPDIHMACR